MAKGQLTTAEQVYCIRALGNAGNMTLRQIGAAVGKPKWTVYYWLRRAKFHRKKRPTPPRRNAAAVDARRKIVRRLLVKKQRNGQLAHPTLASVRIALQRDHGIVVSRMTVQRDTRALGFASRVIPKCCASGVISNDDWPAAAPFSRWMVNFSSFQTRSCSRRTTKGNGGNLCVPAKCLFHGCGSAGLLAVAMFGQPSVSGGAS